MVKNNTGKKTDILSPSAETLSKLKAISKKQNTSVDQLIVKLLDSFNKADSSYQKGRNSEQGRRIQSMPEDLLNRSINIQADLSKLSPLGNADLLELLRRIAQSIENIERSHEQGWSDQRIDLGGIVKKLDKLL